MPLWLENILDITVDETTIINQMYDEAKNIYGYNIINATDPFYKKEDNVTLTFNSKYNKIMIINKGITTYKKLNKEKIETFNIEAGDSYFVIPY